MPDQTPAGFAATHVPVHIDPPELTPGATQIFDWFAAAAIGTCVACGLWPAAAILGGRLSSAPAALFVLTFAVFAVYGGALLAILRLPRRAQSMPLWLPLTLALLQSLTGIGVTGDTARYLDGNVVALGLLVIVAAELPYFLSSARTWAWIALQCRA